MLLLDRDLLASGVGESVILEAAVYDGVGYKLSNIGFNWSVLIEGAGTIDDLGGGRARFISGRSGSFPGLIRVEAVKGIFLNTTRPGRHVMAGNGTNGTTTLSHKQLRALPYLCLCDRYETPRHSTPSITPQECASGASKGEVGRG